MVFENSVSSCIDDIPETITHPDTNHASGSDKQVHSYFREKAFALNYTSDVVIQYDTNMDIIWANKAACTLAQSTLKPLVNTNRCQHILDCCPAEYSGCPVKMAMQNGQEYTTEIQTKDHKILFITAVPFVDSSGHVDSVIEIVTDQTSKNVVDNILSYDYSKVIAYSLRLDSLTDREREVMAFVVQGKSNKSISEELCISPKTTEIHRSRMMKKLQVDSLAELVRLSTLYEFYHQCML